MLLNQTLRLVNQNMNNTCKLIALNYLNINQISQRNYAAKKKQLTEGEIQFQKHTAELVFKEKTTIRGTLFEYHDVETSIQYMKSEGSYKRFFEFLLTLNSNVKFFFFLSKNFFFISYKLRRIYFKFI